MGWRRVAAAGGVMLVVSACGGSAAPPPTPEPAAAAAPSSVPSLTRSPAPSPAVATASPVPSKPTAAATAATTASAATVWVGNTDSEGVYLRKNPAMSDRLTAYADGTALTIVGDDVDGDGQHWKHVKAPDGTEGYVPAMYTVDTPP